MKVRSSESTQFFSFASFSVFLRDGQQKMQCVHFPGTI